MQARRHYRATWEPVANSLPGRVQGGAGAHSWLVEWLAVEPALCLCRCVYVVRGLRVCLLRVHTSRLWTGFASPEEVQGCLVCVWSRGYVAEVVVCGFCCDPAPGPRSGGGVDPRESRGGSGSTGSCTGADGTQRRVGLGLPVLQLQHHGKLCGVCLSRHQARRELNAFEGQTRALKQAVSTHSSAVTAAQKALNIAQQIVLPDLEEGNEVSAAYARSRMHPRGCGQNGDLSHLFSLPHPPHPLPCPRSACNWRRK